MGRKDLDEKLKEARETIIWADEIPLEVRTSLVTGAAYFLMQEVDRLRSFEGKVENLLAMKRQVRDTLLKDYQYAFANDLRARENELMNRVQALECEMKVLEALLDGE